MIRFGVQPSGGAFRNQQELPPKGWTLNTRRENLHYAEIY